MPTTYNWPLSSPGAGTVRPVPTGPQLSQAEIEAAIEAWIVAATGLQPPQVFNVNKKVPQPMGAYVEVRITSLVTVARDEVQKHYDGTRIPGSEIEEQVVGRRAFTASLQSYSNDPTANAGGAVDLLSKCKTALRLPSRLDAFKAAGLSVIESMPVLDLSSRTPGGSGRATMDVRFNCTDSASDFTGYIATVGLARINTP